MRSKQVVIWSFQNKERRFHIAEGPVVPVLLFESGISISVVQVWNSISVKARKNPGSNLSSWPGRFHIAEGPESKSKSK